MWLFSALVIATNVIAQGTRGFILFAFHSNMSNGLYEFMQVSSLVLAKSHNVFLDFKHSSTLKKPSNITNWSRK